MYFFSHPLPVCVQYAGTRRRGALNRVCLDFVLIRQHWIRQSINVPAQSCNHIKGERNMGCDNDLPHLLRRVAGASICLQFVGGMLMSFCFSAG